MGYRERCSVVFFYVFDMDSFLLPLDHRHLLLIKRSHIIIMVPNDTYTVALLLFRELHVKIFQISLK